ncbi:MAG TPA: hypothetical protein VFX88_03495 [Actinomycetota bacterium]|nr:hypothetical protein [Actinomycetota bacterium]
MPVAVTRNLRGGHIRFGDKTRTILLAGVCYLQDLTVTGPIRRDDADRATADLQVVAAGGRAYRLRLSWQAFRPEDLTEITGTLNGRPFTARIPLTCTNTGWRMFGPGATRPAWGKRPRS